MLNVNRLIKFALGTLCVAAALLSQAVEMSQTPLLTRGGQITPNLMLIFDDSGSMDRQYLYQYGGSPGGYGYPGPGTGGTLAASCPSGLNIDITCDYTAPNITIGSTSTTPVVVTYPTWLNSENYAKGDIVTSPTDNKNYECTVRRGCPATTSGGGGSGSGNWDIKSDPEPWQGDDYNKNKRVLRGGKFYRCTQNGGCSSSQQPGVNNAWTLIPTWIAPGASYGKNDYVVHPTSGKLYQCDKEPCESLVSSGSTSYDTEDPKTSSDWDSVPAGTGSSTTTSSGAFWAVSPDINRIYYDPRIRYKVRLTSVAGVTTTMPLPTTNKFNVFLYKNSAGLPAVWGGTSSEPDPTLIGSYFAGYTPDTSLLATAATTGLTYPRCVGSTCPTSETNRTGPFPKFRDRADCTGNSCTLLQEQQNYAIWQKFHSNRLDLAKTGLGYAFQNMTGSLRLGWGVISQLGSGSPATTLGADGSGIGFLNQTRKNDLYTWLYSQDATSSTPLRRSLITIGEYYKRGDANGPWADDANLVPTSKNISVTGDVTTHASCRRSYAMMTTDGYYNDSSVSVGNVDGSSITNIAGETPTSPSTALTYSYNGTTKPYADTTSNTLADVAMKYWITDLRSNLKNNVPLSPTNESFWQNMGFYGVGLGIFGSIPQTQTTLNSITSGSTTWPVPPSTGNDPRTIDDMWHATVNARGRFLSAQNAESLSDGVEGMLAEINRVESSQSGVAASTLSLTTTTKKYTPNYTTGSWIGNVVASDLEEKSGAELCTRWRLTGTWMLEPTPAVGSTARYRWHVANKWDGTPDLAPCPGTPTTYNAVTYTDRKIYAYNGSTFGNFDSANTYATSPATGVASTSPPGDGAVAGSDLINYLRGDQSNEDILDSKGILVSKQLYRNRLFILGDIVNSTPTFIKGALNMNYDKLPAGTNGQAGYATFFANKGSRAEGVLFAGANDGMLHGFRETTGAEVFAFVPRAVMPDMYKLASRSYGHQYFVDGTTIEADACLPQGTNCTAAQWKNLLLGTAGAGAKTVFALDVTSPMSMSETSIKWEISSADTDYANLGNILGDIQTGLTVGGKWVAVFGNGYTSADGSARLYVVDLDTGAKIADMAVETAGNNGLGGVRLLRDDNQRIIAAYAGDLKGSLWKFDLSNANKDSWTSSQLFKTTLTPVKPITAAPAIVKHPLNGYVVAFGTGKLFESGTTDTSDTTKQSLYGVWDSVTPPAITQIDRTGLVQQTISSAIVGTTLLTNADKSTTTASLNYYSVSKNPIGWTTTATTPRGWYIDLPESGQRVIYPIETLVGKYVAVDTLSPLATITNPCLATVSGKAWNYVIDMVTGGGPTEAIFVNNGGIALTTVVSGYENSADGRTRYIKNQSASTSSGVGFTPLSTQQLPSFSISCNLTGTCSTKIKRTWRQLFMR